MTRVFVLRASGRLTLPALVVIAFAAAAGCSGGNNESRAKAEAAAAERAATETRARADAAAALETRRLAELWTYYSLPVGKGHQLSAAIKSSNSVDVDGQGQKAVQLVFRDHPSWGRSSYLVLQSGDFDCYPRCTVPVTVDDQPASPMAARRPRTDEAIAMFINDAPALWRMTAGAKTLRIEFPVKGRGRPTASFDVGGLDRAKMPGWD